MKKRTYNIGNIRKKYLYTYEEICDLFKIDVSTLRRWIRKGLQAINKNSRPVLIYGKDIYDFLNKRQKKRRVRLKSGEFFCTHCQKAYRSTNDKVLIQVCEEKFSENNHKAYIFGTCKRCGSQFRLFSSERKIKKMIQERQLIVEHGERLIWNQTNSCNACFLGGTNE